MTNKRLLSLCVFIPVFLGCTEKPQTQLDPFIPLEMELEIKKLKKEVENLKIQLDAETNDFVTLSLGDNGFANYGRKSPNGFLELVSIKKFGSGVRVEISFTSKESVPLIGLAGEVIANDFFNKTLPISFNQTAYPGKTVTATVAIPFVKEEEFERISVTRLEPSKIERRR